MSLFNRLKRKTKHPANPSPEVVDALTDILVSNISMEIWPPLDPELEKRSAEALEKILEEEAKSTNPKFHRTEEEEDLALEFFVKWGEQMDAKCSAFQELLRDASSQKSPDAKIETIQRAIEAFDNARAWAYSKGKGGELHFQDMWEHLDSRDDPDYSYRDYMQRLILDVQVREQQKAETLAVLKETLIEHPGTLQTEFYSKVDMEKSLCRYLIKNAENDGIIRRTKQGNTYALFWIE